MGLFLWKVGGGATFFVVSLLFGMLPLSIQSTAWLSLATVFGGGVFLGAGFMHLLAEAAETLSKSSSFPWAMLLCCAGYMLMIVVEWLAENVCLKQNKMDYSLVGHGHHDSNTIANDGVGLDLSMTDMSESSPRRRSKERTLLPTDSTSLPIDADASTGKQAASANKHSGYVLIAALSFHSVFDGLALGATSTNTQFNAVAFAVCAHKPVASFALGSMLVPHVQSASELAKLMFVFAITSPIGVGIGLLLLSMHEEGDSDGVARTSAICQSIAAGADPTDRDSSPLISVV
jgi:zinc transporter 1/2/3